jgi:lysozyme family protein
MTTRTPADDDLISRIFVLEGGSDFSNLKNDLGGPTKYGITIGVLAEWRRKHSRVGAVTAIDVKELTEEEARDIIWQQYLVEPGIVALLDQGLRFAMVDFTVLFGADDSVPALQRLVGTRPDGRLGPLTAAAANAQEARHLVNELSVERIKLHASKVVDDLRARGVVLGQAEFLRGWLNRAVGFIT